MTPDILPLHVPRGAEILVPVGETHEPVPAALGGAFVAHDARLLHRGELREGLEEGLVRDFAREVADEEAEVGGVPFEERRVLPCLAAAGPDDGFLLAAGVGDDGGDTRVGVGGRRDGG